MCRSTNASLDMGSYFSRPPSIQESGSEADDESGSDEEEESDEEEGGQEGGAVGMPGGNQVQVQKKERRAEED